MIDTQIATNEAKPNWAQCLELNNNRRRNAIRRILTEEDNRTNLRCLIEDLTEIYEGKREIDTCDYRMYSSSYNEEYADQTFVTVTLIIGKEIK